MNKFSLCSTKFVFDFKENTVVEKATGRTVMAFGQPMRATDAVGAYLDLVRAVGKDGLVDGVDACVEDAEETYGDMPVEVARIMASLGEALK